MSQLSPAHSLHLLLLSTLFHASRQAPEPQPQVALSLLALAFSFTPFSSSRSSSLSRLTALPSLYLLHRSLSPTLRSLKLLSVLVALATLDNTSFKRLVLALCTSPLLAAFLHDYSGDIPALMAITLGLYLNHTSAAAVILLMVTSGELLEDMALDRAGASLQTLLLHSPSYARLLPMAQDVPVEQVRPGDELLVRTDETVPVDGSLLDAQASLDEKLLTGESLPTLLTAHARLLAGSVNKGPPLRMRASGTHAESILHQMQTQLRAALQKKSKLELKSSRLADMLTPFTLATALAGFSLALRRGESVERGMDIVLSVLMSATPCPAAIGVPIAFLSGMNLSSRALGATVKSGLALEALADCDCVVLDKTGTLTQGRPAVDSFDSSPPLPPQLALQIVASLEATTKHVLADAVLRHFQPSQLPLLAVSGVAASSGQGVSGLVAGVHECKVGTKEYCGLGHLESGEQIEAFFSIQPSNCTGRITFVDPLRPDASVLVQRLRSRNLQVQILSGDSSKHLARVAASLGVQYKHCLPHEKVEAVKHMQAQGRVVVMVGDGGNDSPALAQADCGVSVDPSSMSSEAASVVLISGDVLKVDDLIGLSQRVVWLARTTVFVGTLASLGQMALAATGTTTPFQNAVLQELVDFGSICFALQALRY